MSVEIYIRIRDHVPSEVVLGVLTRCGALSEGSWGALSEGSHESRIPGVGMVRILDLRREAAASEVAGLEPFFQFHPRTAVLLGVQRCTESDPCDDAVMLGTLLWVSSGSDVEVEMDMDSVIRIERGTLIRETPGFHRLTDRGVASLDALWEALTRRGPR